MAFSTERRGPSGGYDRARLSAKALPQRRFGSAALACMAMACAWSLWSNLVGPRADQAGAVPPRQPAAANAYAKLSAALRVYVTSVAHAKLASALQANAQRSMEVNSLAALFDSRYLGFAPGAFARRADPQDDAQPMMADAAQSTVEPRPIAASPSRGETAQRAAVPQLSAPPIRTAALRDASRASRALSDTAPEKPSIFQKLLGKLSPLTLAYAAPEDGNLTDGRSLAAGNFDQQTAVYDISAHTVYLPDGTKLEAHSGLGPRIDDPGHTDERMRGSTPPNVYDLKMREGLFHGVQALRLIPEDEHKVFGRSGLLAHTYMLGPTGQSFGCVSFKNYNAFLHAYLNHEIKRLVVVSRLD